MMEHDTIAELKARAHVAIRTGNRTAVAAITAEIKRRIMDVGNTYILDATVKAHTSYQGVLETQHTRAKKPGV